MESMAPPVAKRRPMAEINVVPYIDVMLVLLIIFMVTAPMLVQTVPVDLPNVDAKPSNIEPDDNTLIISINDQGLYFVERNEDQPRAMPLDALKEYAQKIIAQTPSTQLLIRGDEAVAYGKVVTLMATLQAMGVSNVGLITEAPDPQG